MGLLGIQLAQPISDVISFIVALVVVSDSLRKIKALDLEQQELEQEKA